MRLLQRKLLVLSSSVGLIAFCSPSAVIATPIVAYTSVGINSPTSVYQDPTPDSVTDYTGGSVSVSASSASVPGNNGGYVSYAYGNGAGGYTIKPTLDNAFAAASLASGTLKTSAQIGFGTNSSIVGAPLLPGQTNSDATAGASFANSFSTVDGSTGSPFHWTSGDVGTFHLSITGSTNIPSGLESPGTSKNSFQEYVQATLFQPGAIELIAERDALDYSSNPTLWLSLNDQINALFLSFDYRFLGSPVVSYSVDPTKVVALNGAGATDVDFTVDPGQSDFEWILSLYDLLFLDASEENVDVAQDFSHTIQTSYSGPAGSTTYGAVPFSNIAAAPTAVPEPGSLALLASGLAGCLLILRRKSRKGRGPIATT